MHSSSCDYRVMIDVIWSFHEGEALSTNDRYKHFIC